MFGARTSSGKRLLLRVSKMSRSDTVARSQNLTSTDTVAARWFPASGPHVDKTRCRSSATQDPVNAAMVLQNRELRLSLKIQTEKNLELEGIIRSMEIAAPFVGPDIAFCILAPAAVLMLGIEPSAIRTIFSGIEAGLLENFFREQMAAAKRHAAPPAAEPPALNGTKHLCGALPVRKLDGGACSMLITWTGSDICTDLPTSDGSAPKLAVPASANGRGGYLPKLPNSYCLTPRQQQIMGLMLDGHPNKNIAVDLCISQRTVENHRAAIMRRTGATSLPALARIAIGASRDADFRLEPRSA